MMGLNVEAKSTHGFNQLNVGQWEWFALVVKYTRYAMAQIILTILYHFEKKD